MQIANQTYFISGGASGLGAACARRLHAAGANVLLADMATEPGAALAAELGDRASFVHTDVTSEESVRAAVRVASEKFGTLAGAINCAGILGGARVVGKQGPHELELFRRIVEVNLIGTFNVCRLVADALSRNAPTADGERGVLVNTSSVAAWDGQIGQSAYSASKGGVAAMALPMARDLAKLGIRVVAIAPGVFETPMLTALPEEARAALAAQVPFPPRLGRPDEFAALAEHALTNTMLNGCTLRLDGALRMAGK